MGDTAAPGDIPGDTAVPGDTPVPGDTAGDTPHLGTVLFLWTLLLLGTLLGTLLYLGTLLHPGTLLFMGTRLFMGTLLFWGHACSGDTPAPGDIPAPGVLSCSWGHSCSQGLSCPLSHGAHGAQSGTWGLQSPHGPPASPGVPQGLLTSEPGAGVLLQQVSDEVLGCLGKGEKQRKKVIVSFFPQLIPTEHGKCCWMNTIGEMGLVSLHQGRFRLDTGENSLTGSDQTVEGAGWWRAGRAQEMSRWCWVI